MSFDEEEKRKDLESRINQFRSSKDDSGEITPWKGLTLLGSLGLVVAISIMSGLVLGHYLDRKLHTEPWLTLLGLLLGLGAAGKGAYELVKGALKAK